MQIATSMMKMGMAMAAIGHYSLHPDHRHHQGAFWVALPGHPGRKGCDIAALHARGSQQYSTSDFGITELCEVCTASRTSRFVPKTMSHHRSGLTA